MKIEELVAVEILDMVLSRIPQDYLEELKAGTYQRKNNLKISLQRKLSDVIIVKIEGIVLQLDLCNGGSYIVCVSGFKSQPFFNYAGTHLQFSLFLDEMFIFIEDLDKSDLEPLCDLFNDWYQCFDWGTQSTDVIRLHALTKARIEQLAQE